MFVCNFAFTLNACILSQLSANTRLLILLLELNHKSHCHSNCLQPSTRLSFSSCQSYFRFLIVQPFRALFCHTLAATVTLTALTTLLFAVWISVIVAGNCHAKVQLLAALARLPNRRTAFCIVQHSLYVCPFVFTVAWQSLRFSSHICRCHGRKCHHCSCGFVTCIQSVAAYMPFLCANVRLPCQFANHSSKACLYK